jgi:NADP-dependent 3-hydroxy acid dehydrogenase YdfG
MGQAFAEGSEKRMKRLRDRVAVMTGAASGIGRALAAALHEKGCHLALVDWNAAALEEIATGLRGGGNRRVTAHVADVSKREAMAELAREVISLHGECHVLVNNAGVAVGGRIEDASA